MVPRSSALVSAEFGGLPSTNGDRLLYFSLLPPHGLPPRACEAGVLALVGTIGGSGHNGDDHGAWRATREPPPVRRQLGAVLLRVPPRATGSQPSGITACSRSLWAAGSTTGLDEPVGGHDTDLRATGGAHSPPRTADAASASAPSPLQGVSGEEACLPACRKPGGSRDSIRRATRRCRGEEQSAPDIPRVHGPHGVRVQG
jgi:hypothetical protein